MSNRVRDARPVAVVLSLGLFFALWALGVPAAAGGYLATVVVIVLFGLPTLESVWRMLDRGDDSQQRP